MKRFCSIILILALLRSLAAPVFGTASEGIPAATSLTGSVFAAVNTDLSRSKSVEGSFSSALTMYSSLSAVSAEETGISDIITDPVTGDVLTIRSLSFPAPQPLGDQTLPRAQYQIQTADYTVGDTRTISDERNSQRNVRCLYSGIYCTVWGCTTDDTAVQINSSMAKDIADAFDSYYPDMVGSFGQWYDADGDGKLAIFCYNIGKEAVGTAISSYIAGFYRPTDLISSTGHIGSILFNANNYNGMAMDCIHLDTYPTMGYSTPMSGISNAFSTLVHEGQHLINFSNQFISGDKYCGQMDTWLNEAFSMAAEHMICGSDTTANRVRYFNNSYTPGTALTYWSGSLSSYSNSYLFGQYLRTRYGSLTGTDGNTFFKTLLAAWQKQAGGDPLPLAAELLQTTPEQLVLDFWAAIYLRRSSGDYGFRGESWANSLTPRISSTISDNSAGIYNGSAKFYTMPVGGFTPSARQNIAFLQMTETGGVLPEDVPALTNISVQRSGKQEISLSLTASANGTLRYLVSDDTVTGRHALTEAVPLQAGSNHLTLAVSTAGETLVHLCAQGENGLSASLQSVTVPAYIVAGGSCGESVTWTLYGTGTLVFSGQGAMEEYGSSSAVPWSSYSETIKTAMVGEGITCLSSFAFYDCTALTEITVEEGNSDYTAVDGVLFSKDMTTLHTYPAKKAGSNYVIPATVTSIGSGAFLHCSILAHVFYLGTEEQWGSIIKDSGSPLPAHTDLHYAMIWTAVYSEAGQMLQMWEGDGSAMPEASLRQAVSMIRFLLDRTTLQPLGPAAPVS